MTEDGPAAAVVLSSSGAFVSSGALPAGPHGNSWAARLARVPGLDTWSLAVPGSPPGLA